MMMRVSGCSQCVLCWRSVRCVLGEGGQGRPAGRAVGISAGRASGNAGIAGTAAGTRVDHRRGGGGGGGGGGSGSGRRRRGGRGSGGGRVICRLQRCLLLVRRRCRRGSCGCGELLVDRSDVSHRIFHRRLRCRGLLPLLLRSVRHRCCLLFLEEMSRRRRRSSSNTATRRAA
jgi:hypothetical protein